jgi:glycerol-3-phosphate dehydrogenase
MTARESAWRRARAEGDFDVAILGGGINGACLFDALCRRGYRTLLLDKGDFGCGTSPASGMMVWGGLLYLKNLDLVTVARLSRDRDRMIERLPERASPRPVRYLLDSQSGRTLTKMRAALWLYWLIGLGRRHRPRFEPEFIERELVRPGLSEGSLLYEEGFLNDSDARFVLSWITPHHAGARVALNYCDVEGAPGPGGDDWRLSLRDNLHGTSCPVRARVLVNCAGVWTDSVNDQFEIRTPFKHALSKGVYISTERPRQHRSSLVFELGEHGDVLTWVPWGPISMWGPTESTIPQIGKGFAPHPEDIDFLLDQHNLRFRQAVDRASIISVRCGIRGLVVDRNARHDGYSLELSRRQEVVVDRLRPWVSCFGGKLTGCIRMAGRAVRAVKGLLGSRPRAQAGPAEAAPPFEESSTGWARFPGLGIEVPSARWAARYEYCCTIEDYLRRRTPIGQWIPRLGLGRDDVNIDAIRNTALDLAEGHAGRAEALLRRYRGQVAALDRLLLGSPALTRDDALA